MIVPIDRARAKAMAVVAAAFACWLLPPGASAEKATAPARPEVLILVLAAQNGIDQVAITYWETVSKQEARRELGALLESTQWPAQEIASDSQRGAHGQTEMASLSFSAPGVVPYTEGVLPVVPFILAYKQYGNLILIFQVQRPFRFAGPASFQDRHLSVRLQQSSATYRYDVCIKDPRLTAVALPRAVSPESRQPGQSEGRRRLPAALMLALALGASVCVGVFVYMVAASRTAPASTPPAFRKR